LTVLANNHHHPQTYTKIIMKTFQFTTLALAVSVVLGACGINPVSTSLLDQTRNDFRAAQANPKVASYAALEMKLAGDALAKANSAASANESLEAIDKLAYLAKQKIALTQEVASQKAAEAEVAGAGKARDQMLLEQRTQEADQAKADTDKARLAAQRAKDGTAIAEQQAQMAQQKAQTAQQDAAAAQKQTQDAMQRNANLEAQLATLAAKKTERGFVITLGDVLFGTDLARLNADGMRTAQKLADILREHPQRTVLVEGFTDSTGTAAHNQELSVRRADAVSAALQDLGVGRERITASGFGEAHPVVGNASAKDRHLNRRVEIVLSDENGKTTPR
jgi:outer membrane protein OmpA-like peptidoglycan-associated protein